ncbi:type II secretion system F family protein [Endozoicomonas sp. YOMI1]|uniref:type II secretion system F family protein n=1 Tax=Endozoicomonas sp. YOMI1 TaxID=2828739 RepID=UPI002148F240|nr:type II secretion system F family protein [Endozoicomonas sp. YOMI1]
MIWFSLIGLSIVMLLLAWQGREEPLSFLKSEQQQETIKEAKALNIRLLTDQPLKARIRIGLENVRSRIGEHLGLKVLAFFLVVAGLTTMIQPYLIQLHPLLLFLGLLVVLLFVCLHGLQAREKRQFDASFPDALNMLSGAVSSGESLMQAIVFVGDAMEGVVGTEFKQMGHRLSIGQSPDEVLQKSCLRFPYGHFYFFAITLRANIYRGGQLKDIMQRLNQVMFNSHALIKKKKALTAEARMSAYIVAAIPVCFVIMMKYVSPANFDFVVNTGEGQKLLYYVVISEVIGMGIIWLLMKRVQS